MAGPSVQAGEVIIPARIDLTQAAEDLSVKLPKLAKLGGGKAGKELLDELKKGFDLRKGVAQEQLARGLIDKDQFRRAMNELKKEFNDALLPELKRLRKEGQDGTEEYQKLARSLKSVSAEGRRAAQETEKIPSAASRAASAFSTVKGIVGGFVAFLAARGVFRFFEDSIRVAEDAASKWDVLGANVEAAGVSFAKVRPEIEAAASAAQKVTRFDDESFAGALSEVISITHDYAASLKNMDVVLDLAAAKHLDLNTAATLVGRAMIGETDTFARMGIKIQKGSDAIEQLRKQFKGAAEIEGKGLVGTLARVRNAWDDVKQAVGEAILQNDSASAGMDGLVASLVKLEAWIRQNAFAFQFFVQEATNALGAAGRFAAFIARKADPAGFLAQDKINDIQSSPDIVGHPDVMVRRLAAEKRFLELTQERIKALGGEEALRKRLAQEAASNRDGLPSQAFQQQARAIEDLKNQAEASRRVIQFLEAELAKLAHPQGAGGGHPNPPGGTEIEAAQKRLEEQLRGFREARRAGVGTLEEAPEGVREQLQQILALEKQIGEVRADRATAAASLSAAERRQADELIATLERQKLALVSSSSQAIALTRQLTTLFTAPADELPDAVQELGRSFEEMGPKARAGLAPILELRPFLRDLATQVQAIQPSISSLLTPAVEAFETKMARIKEAQARGFITPAEAKKKGEEAAKAFNAGLLSILETLRKSGKLSDAAFKEIVGALKDTGEAADQAGQSLETLAAKAQLFENLARGVLSVADSLGDMDASARKSLQAVADLAAGVTQIAGSGGNPLAILGGGTQVLSGLFTLLDGLGGDKAQREQEQRELVERLVALQRAVEDNTDALRNQKPVGDVAAGLANAADFWDALINGHNPKGVQGNAQDILKNPTLLAQLEQIEEATGVKLVDLLKKVADTGQSSDMNAFLDAWLSAKHILGEAAAAFGKIGDDDIAGQMGRFRQEVDLLDLDTPAAKLAKFAEVLRRIGAGKFADQLKAFTDKNDFAGARKLIQDIFEQLVSGGFSAEQISALFGKDVTAEDVKQILLDANGFLEDLVKGNGGSGGQTTAFQVSRTITERQADLLLTVLTTLVYWMERLTAAAEATAAAETNGAYAPPEGSVPAGGNTPPPPAAPSPAEPPAVSPPAPVPVPVEPGPVPVVLEQPEPVRVSVESPEAVTVPVEPPAPVQVQAEAPEPVPVTVTNPEPVSVRVEPPEPVQVVATAPPPVPVTAEAPTAFPAEPPADSAPQLDPAAMALLPYEERQAAALDAILAAVRQSGLASLPVEPPAVRPGAGGGGGVAYPEIAPPSLADLDAGAGAAPTISLTFEFDALIGQLTTGSGFTAADRDELIAAAKSGGRAAGAAADAELAARLRTVRRFRGRLS